MPPKGGRLRLPLQASVPASSALQGLSGPQVFGKGNTAFWVIFSVIHILSTLLLSTQLYYMGRWKLGEWVQLGAGCSQQRASRPASLGGGELSGTAHKGDGHDAGPLPPSLGVFSVSVSLSPPDSGTWRRIFHVLYTDCIRQCSGPMYMVSGRSGPLPRFEGFSLPGASQTPPHTHFCLQDRMVLLVMGNLINWSL